MKKHEVIIAYKTEEDEELKWHITDFDTIDKAVAAIECLAQGIPIFKLKELSIFYNKREEEEEEK